jgi:hypothetical protein
VGVLVAGGSVGSVAVAVASPAKVVETASAAAVARRAVFRGTDMVFLSIMRMVNVCRKAGARVTAGNRRDSRWKSGPGGLAGRGDVRKVSRLGGCSPVRAGESGRLNRR